MVVDRARRPGCGGVEFAAYGEGRLVDWLSVPRREVLPVALDVAVAVERSAEAGPFKLVGVVVEVGFGEPRRTWLSWREPVRQPSARTDREEGAHAARGPNRFSRGRPADPPPPTRGHRARSPLRPALASGSS